MKKFALCLILLLASCTEQKEQSEPTQTPKTVRVMTIRTIDDGGWFGTPTHDIYIDEPDGGRKDGTIDDDGTLRFGTEEYVMSETVH